VDRPGGADPDRACCAPTAVRAARETCHGRGAAHLSLDLRDAFRTAVVTPFVAGYAAGATPNPCVRCNGGFRFSALTDAAGRLGAQSLHTGHYARLAWVDGVPLIARGVDPDKDQSYMLAGVGPELLERVRFPLGERTKAASRARARQLGLAAADAPESQEVCFLGGGDYRAFLARHGVERRPGPIRTEAGVEVGRHDGVAGFTPGQRRGLGVSGPEPLYVLRTDPAERAVVVAPRGRLGVRHVRLTDARLHLPRSRVAAKLATGRPPSAPTCGVTARGAARPRPRRVRRGGRADGGALRR
jgi:tRNA-specific 2-thiouridylase